jgi:hypothetical protein
VTEAEWLACADPWFMLQFVLREATGRKLRLFAVACCRRIRHLLADERCRAALALAEGFADGLASREALRQSAEAAYDVYCEVDDSRGEESAALAVSRACWPEDEAPESPLFEVVDNVVGSAALTGPWRNGKQIERRRVCRLVRDVFGNPFRRPLLEPTCRAWNDGTVPKLAAAIYDEEAYDRLPILGDALEEAGCADADILSHCRSAWPHVRGCWVLDLVLGKE